MAEQKTGQEQAHGQSTAMVVGPAARLDKLKDYFQKAKGALEAVVPKHLTAERLMKIVTTAASRTPTLLECTPQSIVCALIDCATLGLEPSTPTGHAYLVPYKNTKTGKTECQAQIGYKGFIQLGYQSGLVSSIYAHEIREKDEWDYELGTNKRLYHKPSFGERGDAIAFYAVVKLLHGGSDFELMSRGEVETIRSGSPGKNSDAWINHFIEMAKKTPIRRLAKRIPMSTESKLAIAVERDEANESGRSISPIIDVLPPDDDDPQPPAQQLGRGDALAAKLNQGAGASS